MVTDCRQRIGPQRQQRSLRLTIDVVTNRLGPAERLGVEPGRGRYPRRLQRIRSGHGRLAPGQEKVGDLRRSGTKLDESRRDAGHDRWPSGWGDLCRQPGRDGRIRKSIPAGIGADHSGAERLLEQLISILLVVIGGGGELKPIETISEPRDPPESLGHPGGQIDRRVLVNM